MTQIDLSPLMPSDDELEARRAALVGELLAEAAPARRRRRRFRTALRGGAIVVALLGGAGGFAAAAGVFKGSDVAVISITCSSDISATPRVQSIINVSADPAASCRKTWRDLARSGEDPAFTLPVPAMTACSKPGLGVVVYPTKVVDPAVCERFGQLPLPADFAPIGAKGGAIRKALAPLEAPTRCATLEEAKGMARRALDRAGLRDVPVKVTEPNKNFVCAFAIADGLSAMVIAPRAGSHPPADRSIPAGG